jgi:hypothetical protein
MRRAIVAIIYNSFFSCALAERSQKKEFFQRRTGIVYELEVPSEPTESGFAKRIKLKSYPLIEQGGVLWTYMGPPPLHRGAPQRRAVIGANRSPGCRRKRTSAQAHTQTQKAAEKAVIGDGQCALVHMRRPPHGTPVMEANASRYHRQGTR